MLIRIDLAILIKCDVLLKNLKNIEHGTALSQLGCELAQSDGLAKRMPSADVPVLVSEWKPDNAWQPKTVIGVTKVLCF